MNKEEGESVRSPNSMLASSVPSTNSATRTGQLSERLEIVKSEASEVKDGIRKTTRLYRILLIILLILQFLVTLGFCLMAILMRRHVIWVPIVLTIMQALALCYSISLYFAIFFCLWPYNEIHNDV